MSFREQLAEGEPGVRLSLPDLEWKEAGPSAQVSDPERGVVWRFATSPWSVDLREEHDEQLRSDVERQARHEFEEAFEPREWPPGKKLAPRTKDPEWSPIVEMERLSIGGAAALRIVNRLTYQPGNEIVVGRLQIPLRCGSFHVGAYARADTTGARESVLMLRAGKGEDGGPGFLTQKEYDDPQHDEMFAGHPLSRVRAALRWLVDPEGGGLTVTKPMPEIPGGELILERNGCAIVPPPRYVLVPDEATGMNMRMNMFVRTLLSDESYRMLDAVEYDRDLGLGAIETADDLVQLAEADALSWEREGVTEIETEPRVLERDDGRLHVLCHIRFRIGQKKKRSAARWVLDTDGWIFRACASAPRYWPKKELAADAEAVVRSMRRLEPPESGRRRPRKGRGGEGEKKRVEAPPAPAKKWWQFW